MDPHAVPKEELRKEIHALLAEADLDKTSSKKVRMYLQQKFHCDFTERKKEIDEMIMKFVDSQNSSASSSSEEEEEEDVKIETKIKSPPKRQAAAKKRKANDSDDNSNDNDSGDNYRPERSTKKRAAKATKKETKKKATGTGRKGTGFTRPYQLSPLLAAVVGSDCLPRHEVVKRIWALINERNLYDPKNKQFAICDDQMKDLMGVKRFRTFAMLKYLKPHFLP